MKLINDHSLSGRMVLVVIIPVLLLSACENPGNVGSSFTDTNTSIAVDTFSVSGLESTELVTVTGNKNFFSIGQFDDPLFGNIIFTGLLRPALGGFNVVDQISSDSEMELNLVFDQRNSYGDTTASAEFDLVEMTQTWRAEAWKLNDQVELSANILNSFIVNKNDSIRVPLPNEWVNNFRTFFNNSDANRDSLYRADFPGIAIVAKGSSKIIPVVADSTEFIIRDPEGSDTLSVGLFDWAHSLDRNNVTPPPTGNIVIHSSLESVIRFDMDLDRETLGTINIARAEVVLYQNSVLSEQTLNQVSPGAARSPINNGSIFFTDPSTLPFGIDQGFPIGGADFVETDSTLRYDITSFTNGAVTGGLPAQNTFYITLGFNNGRLHSGLFHNLNGPVGKRPLLIITSVQSESN